MTELRKYKIFITSNEPWSDVWFSKQHYANELSKLNFDVYFVNSPEKWRPWHFLSLKIKSSQIKKNLKILSYTNNFPLRILPKHFLKLNDFLNSWKLKKAVTVDKSVKLIWWQFDPFRFVNVYFFENIKRIYHVVDPFQHVWSDKMIAQNSDLIVLVSDFYKHYYANLNSNTLYIPHGISEDETVLDSNTLVELKEKYGSNYIILVGTINKDIDFDLLKRIATDLNQIKLFIIGPIAISGSEKLIFEEVCKLENVMYLGKIPATDLKYYISLSSIGIVPYKKKKTENIHRTPLKIMNYLAQIKPVVTTINHELEELNGEVIFIAPTKEDFIEIIKNIQEKKLYINTEKTKNYIARVSYKNHIKTILDYHY